MRFEADRRIDRTNMANDNKGYAEASYVGFGFGAVLGAMVIGAATDMMGSPIHTLLAYWIGGIMGGVAGLITGRIAASALL